MSKGSLFWGNAVGKLGETVFYRANGQQRNRTYLSKVNNPKTRAQMSNRVKWANLVNVWRALKPLIAMGMQNRPTRQTDYNAFVSMNVKDSTAYLLKDQAKQNGSIIAPYFLTRGTLGNRFMVSAKESSVVVGDLNLDSATIGELSTAIISNNVGFAIGDQVTIIVAGQTVSDSIVPIIAPAAFKFILTPADAADVAIDVIEVTGPVAPSVANGHLAWEFVGADYNAFGGAVVQSRIDTEGQLLLSTSRLMVESEGSEQTRFPYGATLEEALDSYGYSEAAYLSPASAGAGASSTAARVSEVLIGGEAFTDGVTISGSIGASKTIQISGSNFVEGAVSATLGSTALSLTVVSPESITGQFSLPNGEQTLVISWPSGSITGKARGSQI